MFLRTARLLSPVVAVLGVALAAAPARAQVGGNVDLGIFRPAIDSRGYLTINASQVLGHNELSFGLGSLDWGHGLLRLEGAGAGNPVYTIDNMITATLIAAYGLKLGPIELEVGASVPLRLMNGDRDPDDPGDPMDPNDDQIYKIDGQGLGSVGLHLKTRFLKTSRAPYIGLGVIASIFLPSTDPKDRFLGESAAVPQVIGILDKEFGRSARLRVALNGGIRVRKTTTFTDSDTTDGVTPTGQTVTVGAEVPYGIGIAYALSKQKFDIVAEAYGTLPLGDKENYQPLEALGGVKLYLARNSFLSLGVGRGLLPDKGANPDLRAMIGIVFEPNIGDRDGDGLKDDVDKCPDEPEDFDRFEDEDGCPEPDNDRDGILDEDDSCPEVPEDKDGFEDEDGCPEGNKGDRDGDGILDNVDKCPDDPEDFDGFQDEDGCPDPDNDGDGILDGDDLCPMVAEDKDGFEDEDGCPEPDNDKDRILDKDDKCPNEPETYNGLEDADGCPDRGRVVVTDTAIEILDMVYFEYNKAIIQPRSYDILDAVAATLQGNPSIQLIEIQGHTDERGDDTYNLELSDKRAKSVEKYLADKGVEANRLTAHGYGETQPLDRRSNEAAWAKNRRVAFLILKRASD